MSIQITTLGNGLRVATDSFDSVETASLGLWVGVGARNEARQLNGLSHLLEHMAFKGTRRRTAAQIAAQIEDVGGSLNAWTSRESTVYFARVLKGDVPLAVDILADILQHSVFDEGELSREKGVILQEIGQAHDTPEDVVYDNFQARAYPGQSIGRPILGTAELVNSFTPQIIAAYMSDHYAPSSMVACASGNIDHDVFCSMIGEAFDALSTRRDDQLLDVPPITYTGGVTSQTRDLGQVQVVLGFEGFCYTDPDYYTLMVLSNILGGGMSSRLFQEVREKRGLAYSIYSFLSPFSDGGIFGVSAGTGMDEVSQLVPVILEQISAIGSSVTPEEIARSRAQMKASLLMSLESTSSRCEQLGQHMLVFDRPIPHSEIIGAIDAVDGAAIEKTAARILASAPTCATLGPLGDGKAIEDISRLLGTISSGAA